MDFDPSVVSYAELVDIALASCDSSDRAVNQQYAHLVLAHDDEQVSMARERARSASEKRGEPLTTRIERLKKFWPAEDYHQKYYLRNDRLLMGQFGAMFGEDEVALRESTAAMQVNGFISGNGKRSQLDDEIDSLGLSEEARAHLVSLVGDSEGEAGCPVP